MKKLLFIFTILLISNNLKAQTIPKIILSVTDYNGSCVTNNVIGYNVNNGKQFKCVNHVWTFGLYNVTPTNEALGSFANFAFSGIPTLNCTLNDIGYQTDGPPGSNLWVCYSTPNIWHRINNPFGVTIGSVTTGAPGTSAVVTNTGTPSSAILNFVIPQGSNSGGLPSRPSVGTYVLCSINSVVSWTTTCSSSIYWSSLSSSQWAALTSSKWSTLPQ